MPGSVKNPQMAGWEDPSRQSRREGLCVVVSAQVLSFRGKWGLHMPCPGSQTWPYTQNHPCSQTFFFCFILCCFYWLQHTSRKMHNCKCTAQWIFTKRSHPLNKGKNTAETSRGLLSPSLILTPTAKISNSKVQFCLFLTLCKWHHTICSHVPGCFVQHYVFDLHSYCCM